MGALTTTPASRPRRAPRLACACARRRVPVLPLAPGRRRKGLPREARALTPAAPLLRTQKVSLENIVNGEQTPLSWMESLGKGMFRCNKVSARSRWPAPHSDSRPLRCRQLLGTGSHAVSSVLSMAKKYPRVLVLYEDKLLCCKLDDMDLCTYKWLKKARAAPRAWAQAARAPREPRADAGPLARQLITITNIRRMGRPTFALSNSTEVCVTFDEIDPDTGLIFEEIFSFSRARHRAALAVAVLAAGR